LFLLLDLLTDHADKEFNDIVNTYPTRIVSRQQGLHDSGFGARPRFFVLCCTLSKTQSSLYCGIKKWRFSKGFRARVHETLYFRKNQKVLSPVSVQSGLVQYLAYVANLQQAKESSVLLENLVDKPEAGSISSVDRVNPFGSVPTKLTTSEHVGDVLVGVGRGTVEGYLPLTTVEY
jgi:hypothetical protein